MWWIALVAVLVIVAMVAAWATNALGIPGNWIVLAIAVLYSVFGSEGRTHIGWVSVAAMAILAVLGEVVEFAASARGATKQGGSRRAAVLAVVGSIIGGLSGIFVGLPIPVIGSLVAGMLLAALGALVGAMLGETWKGRSTADSWRVGQAAFWGRLVGTLAKIILGAFMLVIAIVAIVL